MLSILLVEDHLIFAGVLVRLLYRIDGIEEVEVASTAERALKILTTHEFDIAIVDVALPKMNGISLVNLIYHQYPNLPCLMLSGHALAHYVKRALAAGARGYILKDNSTEISEGIRHILDGEIYISPELQEDH
jgi:DNA-binding NarL/FixJ family response regulator